MCRIHSSHTFAPAWGFAAHMGRGGAAVCAPQPKEEIGALQFIEVSNPNPKAHATLEQTPGDVESSLRELGGLSWKGASMVVWGRLGRLGHRATGAAC